MAGQDQDDSEQCGNAPSNQHFVPVKPWVFLEDRQDSNNNNFDGKRHKKGPKHYWFGSFNPSEKY